MLVGSARTFANQVNRWALAALVASVSVGCVERRMTIRTEPPNALVVLDGQEIGHSPVSVPFTYYGERQIRLVKDGFETKTVNQTISTPWYEYFPIDFVSEVIVPWRIRDERQYTYALDPAAMVSTDQLMRRAAQLRVEGQNVPPQVLRRAGLTDADGAPIPATQNNR